MDEENSVVATHWSLGTDFSLAAMVGVGRAAGLGKRAPPTMFRIADGLGCAS